MSWVESNLGESCELYQPQTITTKDLTPDGKYLVYGANGVIGKYDKFNHEEPQLLITCRGATCGSVNISSPFSWINGNAMVVKPKHKEISIRYLEYFFRGAVDLSKAITGAAQPQITRQSLSPIGFKYPPLATQQKIVTKLDAIFAEIDKATVSAEANAKNAEALFQSYLTEVFERGGEGWATKDLIELARDDCTLSYGIVQPGDDYDKGLPIVRPTNLTSKYISRNNLKTINPSLAESYKRTTLTGEEILLCVRGTTGTVSISTKDLAGSNVTRGIVPIRFKDNEMSIDYAYYYFKSSILQRQIKSKTYGAALLQINIADVKKLKISAPSISKQEEIASKLDFISSEVERLQYSQIKKITSLVNFKNSILKQAFNGELVRE